MPIGPGVPLQIRRRTSDAPAALGHENQQRAARARPWIAADDEKVFPMADELQSRMAVDGERR